MCIVTTKTNNKLRLGLKNLFIFRRGCKEVEQKFQSYFYLMLTNYKAEQQFGGFFPIKREGLQ